MAEVCPQAQAELFTESTPSTIETTVEADGTLTILPRKAREEDPGGSGGSKGKPPAPEPVGPLESSWARALHSDAACKLGRCAYANPQGRPNRHLAAMGCDGYHATRTAEPDGRVTIRWGLCPRHREWWRLERIRLAAAKVVRMPHPGIGPER